MGGATFRRKDEGGVSAFLTTLATANRAGHVIMSLKHNECTERSTTLSQRDTQTHTHAHTQSEALDTLMIPATLEFHCSTKKQEVWLQHENETNLKKNYNYNRKKIRIPPGTESPPHQAANH